MAEEERGKGEPSSSSDSDQYRICIGSILDPRWSAWFDGMQLIREVDQTSLLIDRVDQAAL